MKVKNQSAEFANAASYEANGRYYRKLVKSLLISSSIFALISLAILIIVQVQYSGIGQRSNEIAFNSQMNLLNVAMQYTEQASSSVDTYILDSWIDPETEAKWRYYYTSQLYGYLQSSSVRMGGVSFMPVIISNTPDKMVITPVGTCSLDFYFSEYSDLSEIDQVAVMNMLRNQESETRLLPAYSENGLISDLYIIEPYVAGPDSNAIIITRLYLSRFLEIAENQYPYIILADGTMIPFRLGDDSDEIGADVLAVVGNGEERAGFYSDYLANMLVQYASYFASDSKILLSICLWLFMIAGYCVLLYILVYRQAKRLYQPILDAISSDSNDTVIDRDTDEMEVLKKRSEMLLDLADQLEKANKEVLHYATIRVYRNLLENGSGNMADDGLDYAVAIIRFRDYGESASTLISFQLILQIKECEWLHYVPFGFDRFALIMRVIDSSDARAKLLDIVHSIPDDADVSVVLSDVVRGNGNIHKAYEECKELLCIVPARPTQQIITAEDAKGSDGYSFSAEEEVVLINMINSASPESLRLFDSIVARNMDAPISSSAKVNFCYCLVSMVSRIFSDMRVSPPSLIGEDIDYSGLYQLPAEEIISRLRNVIERIIQAVSSSADQSDVKMLEKMKKFIHENYMRDIGLQDLADAFNISPKYCGMLFSKLSNDTFKNYLNLYRTEEAKRILRDEPNIKIQDLARRVGFNSPTSFIRVFSRYTGMTPKSYAEHLAQ